MGTFGGTPWGGSLWGGGTAGPPVIIRCRDLLYIAFREARILKRPQALNAENELRDGLIFLNQQVDYWAARGCYAWTTTFALYALTPGNQPHQIGPGLPPPDFDVPMRPVSIESASIVLTGPTPVDVQLNLRDSAWWSNNSTKTTHSSVPTDLYYEPDFPYGQLWLYPIPTMLYGLRLETNVVLQQFQTLDDSFIAPPAYQAAVVLTLAEELCDIWGTPMPANLARRALKARDALQSNNFLPPRIASADYGTFSRPSGDWNWLTGTLPNR